MERCYFFGIRSRFDLLKSKFCDSFVNISNGMEAMQKFKVFFCGTVQLFAHFILCYKGMSLTSVDFLMCLGRYTYGELADNIEPGDYSERYPRELLTSVRGGARIWLSAVEGHRTTTLLPFGPWSRHPLQLWNKSLSSCC